MTSSSPDIESLIAAARERHRDVGEKFCACARVRPCPDRLLLDALVPVYEAARETERDAADMAIAAARLVSALRDDIALTGSSAQRAYEVVAKLIDEQAARASERIRAALGEQP